MKTIQKIICLLIDPPYSTPLLEHRLIQIQELLKSGKNLSFFFYMDGIHQLSTDQYPRNFTNIGKFWEQIHKEYPQVAFYACSRCSAARGYLNLKDSNFDQELFVTQKLLPFVSVVSIRKLGDILAEGYRLAHI